MSAIPRAEGGLAIDIDETCAWTVGLWFKLLSERFGNPENLDPHALEARYEFTFRVTYWHGQEVQAFMEAARSNPDYQMQIEPMPGAAAALNRMQQLGQGLSCYATTRPDVVTKTTVAWLKQHGFPDLPVIARPEQVSFNDGNRWKVQHLVSQYPNISGLVDNSGEVMGLFPTDYRGLLVHFGASSPVRQDMGDRFSACATWDQVVQAVERSVARARDQKP